jgi:hypothetical protein
MSPPPSGSDVASEPDQSVEVIISDTESEVHSDVSSGMDDGDSQSSEGEDDKKLVLDADFGAITFSTS